MTPSEALKRLDQETCPATICPDFDKQECISTLKEAIDCLMIYIKNTTIDCIQPIVEQAYVVSIRSKITKQVEYEKIIKFLKKYNKEEYEKCLNIFTSK